MTALFNAGFLGVCFELVPDQLIFFFVGLLRCKENGQ